MSDDFQRGLQARLAHLIGEASQWSRGSGAHPPGLVKALNEAFEYGCAEIERLQRENAKLRLEWGSLADEPDRTADEPSDAYRKELENIANAKRFDRKRFDDDTSFADWAQSRARHALTKNSEQS